MRILILNDFFMDPLLLTDDGSWVFCNTFHFPPFSVKSLLGF